MKRLVLIISLLVPVVALAGRSAGGTYSLPAGNPVVTGTTITTTWANSTLSDIAQGITDSLDRNGRGSMAAQLRLLDGTVSTPGIGYGNETNTGLFRNGSGDLRLSVLGVSRQWWAPTGIFSMSATADGASAVGYTLDTTTALANAAAKILSIKTGGAERINVLGDGTFNIATSPANIAASAAGANLVLAGNRAAGDVNTDVHIRSTVTRTTGNLLAVLNNATAKMVLDFNGVLSLVYAPASTVAVSNALTAKNIVKAWAVITMGFAGACTVNDGFNVTSCSYSGSDITVTFASAFASQIYASSGSVGSANVIGIGFSNTSTTTLTIYGYTPSTAALRNWGNTDIVAFMTVGAQ